MVERLLTLEEVADLLRLPVATLYRQRYVGERPGSLGFRIGRHVRFRASDIDHFIEDLVASSERGSDGD
jgi:excisionase family DNA binding protein